jgi:hypothetical protein
MANKKALPLQEGLQLVDFVDKLRCLFLNEKGVGMYVSTD